MIGNKKELLEKMVSDPLGFTPANFKLLLQTGLNFDDLRNSLCKIYDLNPSQLLSASNANTGSLGRLNKKDDGKREKRYNKKLLRSNPLKQYVRIYAEGDSWFQFPYFITDIVDWLNKEEEYLLFTEAYGGDWFSNILYESQIIPSLSLYKPHFFMISGGGNDLVGGNRLAIMLQSNYGRPKYSEQEIHSMAISSMEKEALIDSQPHITKEFYAFLHVMRAQYHLLFENLYSDESKHKNIITITQGYDYPFPSPKNNFSLALPHQYFVNWQSGTGKWLYRPMLMRSIYDAKLQRNIIMTMMYEFNEMMKEMVSSFDKVYHIDFRGIAPEKDDWFDELHLKSHMFRKAANVYKYVFENYTELSSTVKATDILKLTDK